MTILILKSFYQRSNYYHFKTTCFFSYSSRLSDCSITEEGYKALASVLRSNPSHLIELDLTGNDPGQSGVKQLSDLLQDPNYQLKILR